jgi:hypothetical protein
MTQPLDIENDSIIEVSSDAMEQSVVSDHPERYPFETSTKVQGSKLTTDLAADAYRRGVFETLFVESTALLVHLAVVGESEFLGAVYGDVFSAMAVDVVAHLYSCHW